MPPHIHIKPAFAKATGQPQLPKAVQRVDPLVLCIGPPLGINGAAVPDQTLGDPHFDRNQGGIPLRTLTSQARERTLSSCSMGPTFFVGCPVGSLSLTSWPAAVRTAAANPRNIGARPQA